eukprot:Hpha_TRINITY_DN15309_c4_g3::TRINITY_DN15309_c4_g3_i1::g.88965::m.88965
MCLQQCVELCNGRFLALLDYVRKDRAWRRRLTQWVFKSEYKHGTEISASHRFLLYVTVMREVEHQEELDDLTINDASEDQELGDESPRTWLDPVSAEDGEELGPESPRAPAVNASPAASPRDEKSPPRPMPTTSPVPSTSPVPLALKPLPPVLVPAAAAKSPTSEIGTRARTVSMKKGEPPSLLSARTRVMAEEDITSPLPREELIRILQGLNRTEASSGKPRPQLPPPAVACRLFRQAGAELSKLNNVISLEVPSDGRLVVVGDLHGQFGDMLHILDREQEPAENALYLFNGDFVDRGPDGCEIVCYLYCLLLLHPGCVWLNRGNHEDRNVSQRYGFGDEVRRKGMPPECWEAVQWSFEQLPLVYVLRKQGIPKCVVLHGGLPDAQKVTFEEIDKIERRKPIPSSRNIRRPRPRTEPPSDPLERVFQALVWSDPRLVPNTERVRASDRGAGFHFGASVTQEFLDTNGVQQCVIRSHDVVHSGYLVNHQSSHDEVTCCTVFSASNYHGPHSNQGAYLVITSGDPEDPAAPVIMTPHQFTVRQGGPRSLHTGRRRRASTIQSVTPFEAELPELEKRTLASIGSLIFQRRAQLVVEFQRRDPKKTGQVQKKDWVAVMQVAVARRLPWWSLARYLVRIQPWGFISYIPFLERFQNRLFRKWMSRWTLNVMPHIGFRLSQCARKVQDRTGAGKATPTMVSYQDVCQELTRTVPGLTSTEIYYLFVCQFDLDNDGYLDSMEWNQLLSHGCQDGTPGILELWSLRTSTGRGDKSVFTQLIKSLGEGEKPEPFVKRAAKSCNLTLSEEEEAAWVRTATDVFSTDGLVTPKGLTKALDSMSVDLRRARAMEEIIEYITSAKMHLRTVFCLLDDDLSGDLSLEEFREGMARMSLSGDLPFEWETTLYREMDIDNDGKITIDEFLNALAVVDTWPSSSEDVNANSFMSSSPGSRSPMSPALETSGEREFKVEVNTWQSLRGKLGEKPEAEDVLAEEASRREKLLDRETELRERHLLRLAVGVNRVCVRRQLPPQMEVVRV